MDRRAAVALGCAAGVVAAAVAVSALATAPAGPVTSHQTTPTALPTPPVLTQPAVQPAWDPREVGDLPRVEVPGLPARLEPPEAAGPPAGWASATALVEDDRDLWLVDDVGAWARLGTPERPVDVWGGSSAVTTDGSRVVWAGRSGLWVYALAEGRWERLDYPTDFTRAPDWGRAEMVPDSPDGLWIADRRGPRSWYVDLEEGAFTPYAEPLEIAASAPGGPLVRIQWHRGHRYLSVGVPGDEQVTWDGDTLESLTGPATDGESLAAVRGVGGWSGTRGRTERNGLVAMRLDDLSVRAYLPVPDPNYWYTDARQLTAHTWLDDATVLASVLPQDTGGVTGTRYLFTWDVETGELRLASALPGDLWLSLARYDSVANPSPT